MELKFVELFGNDENDATLSAYLSDCAVLVARSLLSCLFPVMSGNARGDRTTREEEERNLYNPRSPSFCRACVDLSTYKKIKPESRKASPFFLDPKSTWK